MNTVPNLAGIGALIGHPTRAVILEALIDGCDWTAGELAGAAGVTPQTASAHLRRLLEGGLVRVDARGRHRYFSLAGPDVADALESLEVIATKRAGRPGTHVARREALAEARTCYDHLAGRLGVAMIEAMVGMGCFREGDGAYMLTARGRSFLDELGVDLNKKRDTRRTYARKCFDWSEQRYHLGGALGAALANRFFDLDWLRRVPKSRVVTVTSKGGPRLAALGLIPEQPVRRRCDAAAGDQPR